VYERLTVKQDPEWHPTDIGQVKMASHVMQYINIKFGWDFLGTGDEVEHGTTYWNNEANY
jgi:hypothetical protein